MTLDINLSANSLCGIDCPDILLPENGLMLKFNSEVYCINLLHISARNGDKVVEVKLKRPFELDLSELLFPGIIECDISMVCGSEVVKTWRLQDLYIKDINHRYEVVPELEILKGAIKEISEILKKNNLK